MRARLALALAIGVAACGADILNETPAVTVGEGCIGIARVSPASVTLHVGETVHFTAAALCGVTVTEWRWSGNDTTLVSVDSVRGDVRALKVGIATVTARSASDATIKAASVANVVP